MNTKLNNKFNYDSSRDTNTDMNTLISQGITGIMYTEGTNQTNLHTPLGETTSGYSTISYYNVETISYSGGSRLCQIALSCLSHNPGMWYRIKHDANWRKWNKVSIDGHTHSASNITSGTLPVTRGGTGVTSIDALKNVLGIGSSSSTITKMVAGSYTGDAIHNNGVYGGRQIITVSELTILKGIIVVIGDGLFGWRESARDPVIYAGISGIKTNNTEVGTIGVTIIPNTNTFEVITLSSSYGGTYLNNNDRYVYLAFGN